MTASERIRIRLDGFFMHNLIYKGIFFGIKIVRFTPGHVHISDRERTLFFILIRLILHVCKYVRHCIRDPIQDELNCNSKDEYGKELGDDPQLLIADKPEYP